MERADGAGRAAEATEEPAEKGGEAERREDGAVRAVDGQGRAGEQGTLEVLAKPPRGGREFAFETGDALHLKADVGKLVVDEFVADAPQDGMRGGDAETGVVFLGDEFGDEQHAAGPGEVAEGADLAKNGVGENAFARGDTGVVHEAQEEGGVLVFLAHEEDRGLVKGGVAVLEREKRGEPEIVPGLGRLATLKLGDGGGDPPMFFR